MAHCYGSYKPLYVLSERAQPYMVMALVCFTDPETTIKATYLFTLMFTTRTTMIAIELVNIHKSCFSWEITHGEQQLCSANGWQSRWQSNLNTCAKYGNDPLR